LIEKIRAAAGSRPDEPAVITDETTTTYAQLVATAEKVASALAARQITRFAIVEQDTGIVLALLAGASLAGAEACVYPPIERSDQAPELAERFDHAVIVTASPELAGALEAVSPDELTNGGQALAGADPPAERPHLVLTTGTTGVPRGVRHDWWRIMRSAGHVRPTPDQRWLLAYGLHQFAGLQVLVHVTSAQATLVAPATRRPRVGLAAIRLHDVDHVSATPTFWRFLLADLRSDGGPMPRLRRITVGGEVVPERLLSDLRAAFPDAAISQIYSASESGSSRSVRDDRAGLPASLLDAPDDADIAHKVVDGELWVRSRIGMLGYYGEQPVDPDAWRPTGDLVEVEGDRVVFRGRL
jgi:acyl-CoA synthetase (AMP-forming)/AMP-acid ligase II